MKGRRLRDIIFVVAAVLMAHPLIARPAGPMAQDSLLVDSLQVGSLQVDSLQVDSLLTDSLLIDSLALDSLLLDTLTLDSLAVVSLLQDSTLLDTVVLSKRDMKRMARDSARRVRDSIRAVKDSIRLSTPRILETGFLPDSMWYKRVISWTTGTYFNEYRPADMDTTFNDWYTEYPFYKEDIDVIYLGTVGSPVQNVNFFKRRELDVFKAYAPYITYSHTPENMPFFNTKSPYTELAYWGTLFAFQNREEINIRFMHTQNITPKWNLGLLFQSWKAAGMLINEETVNNSLEFTTNYLGDNYVLNAGFIHHNIERDENGGVQDTHMVRDTTVDTKTLAVNLQNAHNKLSRNTAFISQSYNISLRSGNAGKREEPQEEVQDSLQLQTDSLSLQDMSLRDQSLHGQQMPEQPGDVQDSTRVDELGDGPMLTLGHVGELSRYYRYYTDAISASDAVGSAFYNDNFYINPSASADSTRLFSLENKLFFRLQPWARDAVVSEISGGVGYQWNSIYSFSPQMFLTGNRNVHHHNMYVYASAGGRYKKYFNWGASAQYSFLGYYQNDFNVDGHIDVAFYPFRDKMEPVVLRGRFNTALKEPDWFSQHYYSNHYAWENNFSKTSTTKLEAELEIPKWRMEAFFGYSLVNGYLYHDTLGIARQDNGIINVMSAYLRKEFKVWLFRLDNQVLFQLSSNNDVLPLPLFTFRMKYYLEIEAVKRVLTVQLGADVRFNTLYYAPTYNPALATFQLQTREQLGNNPYIDLFLNMQWNKVNVFVKVVNIGQRWPDGGMMFSAYPYIKPTMSVKVGIHWPFYI